METMPPRRASAGEWTVRSRPRTAIWPLSGRIAPVRILTRVLLPAPLAPISAWTSPGRTARDAECRATTAPYVLEMPVASRSRSVVVAVIDFQSVKGEAGGCRGAAYPSGAAAGRDYSPGPLQAMAWSGV